MCVFLVFFKNCFAMNNYNSALCIMSGVQNFTVHRLKKTWDELDKASKDVFEVKGGKIKRLKNKRN